MAKGGHTVSIMLSKGFARAFILRPYRRRTSDEEALSMNSKSIRELEGGVGFKARTLAPFVRGFEIVRKFSKEGSECQDLRSDQEWRYDLLSTEERRLWTLLVRWAYEDSISTLVT